jgi:hypothetical protein
MAYRIDQSSNTPKAVQASTWQVGNMGQATKGNQVMWANAVNGNSSNDYHVATMIDKAFTQCHRWIKVIASE